MAASSLKWGRRGTEVKRGWITVSQHFSSAGLGVCLSPAKFGYSNNFLLYILGFGLNMVGYQSSENFQMRHIEAISIRCYINLNKALELCSLVILSLVSPGESN